MQSVGCKLREARERKGYSLDEVNARTRINSRNLIAIEGDEVLTISSPFFYRSFVRQYAETVDLDFQILAPQVEMLAGNMRQPDLPGQGSHATVRVASIQPRPKGDSRWMIPVMLLAVTLVLGSAVFAAWKYYRPLVHAATLTPAIAGQRAAATDGQKPASQNSPVAGVPSSAQASSNGIHLELAATEPTWLSVTADGKPAYQGILEPAETKVLNGQESAEIKTGNAGGVVVTFNGKEIGPIGRRGQRRIVVFTKTSFEVQRLERPTLVPANHIGG